MAKISTSRLVTATIVSLLITGLFGFRLIEAERASSKTIGIYLAPSGGPPFEVIEVMSDGPAEKAGMEVGDLITGADGVRFERMADFDIVSDRFEPGTAVQYDVIREGEDVSIHLVPGVDFEWWYFPLDGFVLLASLGLMILTCCRQQLDPRSKLLSAMFALIALGTALPFETVGKFGIETATRTSYFLIDALEVAIAMHLVMLIPRRPAWLEHNPWIVSLSYALFLTIGVAAAGNFLADSVYNIRDLPWPLSAAQEIQWYVGGPIWGVALIGILVSAIRRSRIRIERLQAQLVLVGLLPLIILIFGISAMTLLEMPVSGTIDQFSSLFMLPFLVTIAIAMFRYELIDMELVIERGVLFSLLTSALFLLFYAFLGIGGAVASEIFGEAPSMWVASIAALLLGLLFNPLRRSAHQLIERRIFHERGQQRQRLTRLAAELPASGSVAAMAVKVVESLRGILAVSDASLYLANSESGRLDWEASDPERFEAVEIGGRYLVEDESIRGLIDHGPLRKNLVPRHLMSLMPMMEEANAEMLLPLESNGRLIGILALGATDRHRAEDQNTLELFASNVAMVFENVRLFQSATFDGLTGLPRREIVLDRLRDEIKRSERHRRPLSVAMLDLDHFKAVNDRHGHLVGDSILRTVAETFRLRLRTTDQIGRFGGEEFIVILPETQLEQALELAEDLRISVESIDFHTERGERVQTRVSIGVATLQINRFSSTAEDLIAAADSALYRAKQNGRNRTEVALVM